MCDYDLQWPSIAGAGPPRKTPQVRHPQGGGQTEQTKQGVRGLVNCTRWQVDSNLAWLCLAPYFSLFNSAIRLTIWISSLFDIDIDVATYYRIEATIWKNTPFRHQTHFFSSLARKLEVRFDTLLTYSLLRMKFLHEAPTKLGKQY